MTNQTMATAFIWLTANNNRTYDFLWTILRLHNVKRGANVMHCTDYISHSSLLPVDEKDGYFVKCSALSLSSAAISAIHSKRPSAISHTRSKKHGDVNRPILPAASHLFYCIFTFHQQNQLNWNCWFEKCTANHRHTQTLILPVRQTLPKRKNMQWPLNVAGMKSIAPISLPRILWKMFEY